MASGKSTIGLALAAELGWEFVDLDAEIERETGERVEEIFASRGEGAFRRLETELTPRFTGRDDVVVAPGGGWVTNPGLLQGLPPDTLTVWLKASAAEILRRVATDPEQPVRPLLAGEDPAARIEALLARRAPLYGQAAVAIETDRRTVGDIVRQLTGIIRSGAAVAEEGND